MPANVCCARLFATASSGLGALTCYSGSYAVATASLAELKSSAREADALLTQGMQCHRPNAAGRTDPVLPILSQPLGGAWVPLHAYVFGVYDRGHRNPWRRPRRVPGGAAHRPLSSVVPGRARSRPAGKRVVHAKPAWPRRPLNAGSHKARALSHPAPLNQDSAVLLKLLSFCSASNRNRRYGNPTHHPLDIFSLLALAVME